MTGMVGGVPNSASIREVGPRDGFQNEPETIPTAQKIELIDATMSQIRVLSDILKVLVPIKEAHDGLHTP